MLVWHCVHGLRPEESDALKISRWMLESVGSRLGVGPATSLSFSSHADAQSVTTTTANECSLVMGCLRFDHGRTFTTSVPFMSSWPFPQYSEQRTGNSPADEATKSMVTVSPLGIFSSTLNFLIPMP